MRLLNSLLLLALSATLINCKKDKDEPDPVSHTHNFQPGNDGQDTYVSKIDNEPTDGNVNLDWVNELVMGRWKANANPNNFTARSYIKFTGLSTIPANATINSATLYLYGKTSSLAFPNGNSSYPGSLNAENSSYIQRVIGGNWDESTLTWNTMPTTTTTGQAMIGPSSTQWGYGTVVDVTEMVKEMVAQPSTNYGFMIRLVNETPSRSLVFATSENADPNLRPKLLVQATY